ncbi:uncharacterized protein J4E78_008951 [Alternaria triticimaculans]|uniref:uncharacterized protein n=1 Tax=Alternaria triticimaculans TaxID=297637 RepID=UPI0020C489F8|nr:uncharacterized protein J4E78_008951 [Alternaria triticimaculans]KAI4647635.1 hypothetical protein J4E78_008951 [Alternaria triticimaculans]
MDGPPKPPGRLDYYELLGVHESASSAEVDAAYKRLRLIHHPDSKFADAKPSTELFQNIGIAWKALKSSKERARYDKDHHKIRGAWNVYRVRLGAWEATERENKRGQARVQERQRKILEEEAELEREKARKIQEKAVEAALLRSERIKADKLRQEEVKRREEGVRRVQEQLQEERRRQGLARAKEEARVKADWEKAQKRRDSAKDHGEPQDELPRPSEIDDEQSPEPNQEGSQKHERLARKQREADERQAKVFADAQKRNAEAAEERLRRQQELSMSLKRPVPGDREDAQDETAPKKPKLEESMTSGLRKHMAHSKK